MTRRLNDGAPEWFVGEVHSSTQVPRQFSSAAERGSRPGSKGRFYWRHKEG